MGHGCDLPITMTAFVMLIPLISNLASQIFVNQLIKQVNRIALSCQLQHEMLNLQTQIRRTVHTFLIMESTDIMDKEWLKGASTSGTSSTVTQVCLEVASVVTDVTQAFLLLELFSWVSVWAAGPLSATVLVGKVSVSCVLCTEQDTVQILIMHSHRWEPTSFAGNYALNLILHNA